MRDAREFGACGDGVTKDTAALQAALDAGGMVRLTPGTYVSGTLYLRSHGGLWLEPGATLLASPDPSDYNAADFCVQNSASQAEVASGGHLLVGLEVEDVTLGGGGVIHGNSQAFLNERDPGMPLWYRRVWRPSQMVFLCECRQVCVSGLTLRDSPYWHCFVHGCEYVSVEGLTILGETAVPNNDGIDIDCCSFVTVRGCLIDTGDDCLTIRCDQVRLKRPRPSENIVFSDCVLRSGYANAIRVGVGSGEVRNCRFQNIVVERSRTAISMVTKYSDREVPGGLLHDVSFSGLQIACERLCNLKLDNVQGMRWPSERRLSDVDISDVRGSVSLTSYVCGNGLGEVSGISFRGLRLKVDGSGPRPDRNASGWWGRSSTRAGFDVRQARDVTFDDCRLDFNDSPGWEYAVEATDCVGVEVSSGCRMNRPVLV